MNEAYAWTRYSSSHICYDGMVSVKLHLRSLTEADWGLVRAIYLDGIASGHATFETGAPDWEEWDSAHLPTPRLVAISGETIVGWAALNAVSKRSVYSGVAEVSVYVDKDSRGAGVGRALLDMLVSESELSGFWTLQASIFPENTASLRLHAGSGFRVVGTRQKIGRLNGIWRDTLLLERRSKVIGIE